MTIKEEIDKLYKQIQDSMKEMAIPKIFVDKNVKVEPTYCEIPEDATPFERKLIEELNELRSMPRCPKCDPDEGGILILDK